jgi:putative transposase
MSGSNRRSRLQEQIQHDVANQLVWLTLQYECETIVFEPLEQSESPDVSGISARSLTYFSVLLLKD